MRLRYLLGALCAAVSVCATAVIPAAEQTVAVEFYHPATDHYFITSETAEIGDLDTGKHPGWVRTGYRFSVIKAGSTWPGTEAMCRFFSESLNTHFYSVKPTECEDVKTKFPGVWTFESAEVFRSFAVDPNTGLCPADTQATYRLWNQQPAANHRYTDQLAAYVYMLGKGYLAEGDGSPSLPVAFCTPTGGDVVPAASPSAPNCTMTASSGNPAPGSTLSLNVTCTNNPTTFLWQGCTSTTASCTATSATSGQAKYTLYAANSMGPGDPVVMNVAWGGGGAGGGAVPICTISSSSMSLATGSTLTLTANCSQTPTSYEWLECNYLVQSICNPMPACVSTSKTCSFGNTIGGPGFARYAVAASNAAGKGPRVPVDVEWTSSGGGNPPPPPPGGGGNDPVPVCSVYASNDQPTVGSNVTLTASCTGNPTGYQWSGVQCSQWQCLATSATAGSVNYTVTAYNASGSSQASVTVVWGGSAPNPVPSCTVSASNSSPQVGSTITVTANCSNNPTSFAWTGCTSTTSSCTDSSSAVGTKNYTIVAANANGSSQPATAVVNWVAVPTSPPACQITASSVTPTVGQNITLTASCQNGPTSYEWTNCPGSSSSSTCTATATAAGTLTYYVAGINQYGKGNVAGIQVTWQTGTPPPPPPPGGGMCSEFSKVNTITVSWGDLTRFRTAQYGGFGQDTVFVMVLTVPTSPASYGIAGYSTMFEYGGEPTLRKVTLSKSPCDFRPVDLTGVNGPMDSGQGVQASIIWNVGIGNGSLLAPGGTYYFNFRNLGCASSSCEAMIENYWPR